MARPASSPPRFGGHSASKGQGRGAGGQGWGDSGVASGKAISHYGLLFGRWRISGPHDPRGREQPTWHFDTPGIHIFHTALRFASGQGLTNATPPEGRRAQARTRLLAMGGKPLGGGYSLNYWKFPGPALRRPRQIPPSSHCRQARSLSPAARESPAAPSSGLRRSGRRIEVR